MTAKDEALIDELVAFYEDQSPKVAHFQNLLLSAITDSEALAPLIHSVKGRLKLPDHLRGKLRRKIAEAKAEGREFDVTKANLLEKINDLAGIRLLHLHTRQIKQIDPIVQEILKEESYGLLEGPSARTWDDEYRDFFQECGIETQKSPSMYTSVHYVIGSASRTLVTCELQVRTLMEEVWGEVDHRLNYPERASSVACREQLKVLARVTSSATRLVDSIFLTQDAETSSQSAAAPVSRRRSTATKRLRVN
jgi:putative GTP pyrophosphokinase